jgi:hypothetical protein
LALYGGVWPLGNVCGVNENFISAAVEGALVMAVESIDLDALQDVATESRAAILPMERDVQRAACTILKKWWPSFGYDYVLAPFILSFVR